MGAWRPGSVLPLTGQSRHRPRCSGLYAQGLGISTGRAVSSAADASLGPRQGPVLSYCFHRMEADKGGSGERIKGRTRVPFQVGWLGKQASLRRCLGHEGAWSGRGLDPMVGLQIGEQGVGPCPQHSRAPVHGCNKRLSRAREGLGLKFCGHVFSVIWLLYLHIIFISESCLYTNITVLCCSCPPHIPCSYFISDILSGLPEIFT